MELLSCCEVATLFLYIFSKKVKKTRQHVDSLRQFWYTVSTMIQNLRDILLSIGLNEKESTVFETLLYSDHLKASDISRKTKIQRTTVYTVLKGLEEQGLVSTVSVYGVTEFQAVSPALLSGFVERKKEALENSMKEIEKISQQIREIRSASESLPKVSFFHGKEGVKQAYEDTLEGNKSKEIFVFSGPDVVFKEMGKEYVDYYVRKRARLGIKSFQIAPSTQWGKYIQGQDRKYKRVTRLIPEEFAFDTEMVMYEGKLGIFSFKKGKLAAVIIEDEAISSTMRALYGYIESTVN